MIEIIKKSTKQPPEKIKYVKKCNCCKCLFTYQKEDIIDYFINDIIYCPYCNHFNDIRFKKLYKEKKYGKRVQKL